MEEVPITVAEAVTILNPPISERALREILHALAIPPVGRRWTGTSGRPASLYNASEIQRIHGAVAPWLDPSHRFRTESA